MEPLHITEFASKRYFDKINQLPKDQHPQLQQQPQPQQTPLQLQQQTDGPLVEASSSKFILPIRHVEKQGNDPQAKHVDHNRAEKEKEKERRRLFGLVVESSGVKPKSLPFDQLFLSLPNELQIQIIASLPLSDVLNLRVASRAWHSMVTFNELPIVRYQLQHEVPAYATRLYPVSETTGYTLHYLCGLWHRLHVAAKLSRRMCDWCTKEIFLKTTREQVTTFALQRERMYRRLIPLLFTVFHFFENYRKLHLKYIQEHGYGLERTPYTVNPIEVQIMNMYDDRTLLQVHQVFPLVVASFCRRLRPPSYAGLVERAVRGYLREKPADEVHTAILCLGGLRQVLRLWEVKGYNTRRGAVDAWYNDLQDSKEAPKCAETISRETKKRGLMGLGRKMSLLQVRDASVSQANDTSELSNRPIIDGFLEHAPTRGSMVPQPSLVFHTSLAAGMPMGKLEQEQYKLLLSDLPVLQKVWLSTAEAMILDRRIVERPVDIKRNAQVMLDLIKEDGVVDEDVWWYGMITTKSIRPPPLEAIEEDTID
ncbi:hypothetical protein VP1G_07670 [Cytospora mali]|uniref:F-box domain-containing protein n=1 Tax=Cytospora mali TaxID=578113 RepID=A0A194V8U1_CYTMA|nr:hypothetical protein VP1G_07670 [Valsa mali var. pyri (nom. inval.)]